MHIPYMKYQAQLLLSIITTVSVNATTIFSLINREKAVVRLNFCYIILGIIILSVLSNISKLSSQCNCTVEYF